MFGNQIKLTSTQTFCIFICSHFSVCSSNVSLTFFVLLMLSQVFYSRSKAALPNCCNLLAMLEAGSAVLSKNCLFCLNTHPVIEKSPHFLSLSQPHGKIRLMNLQPIAMSVVIYLFYISLYQINWLCSGQLDFMKSHTGL